MLYPIFNEVLKLLHFNFHDNLVHIVLRFSHRRSLIVRLKVTPLKLLKDLVCFILVEVRCVSLKFIRVEHSNRSRFVCIDALFDFDEEEFINLLFKLNDKLSLIHVLHLFLVISQVLQQGLEHDGDQRYGELSVVEV